MFYKNSIESQELLDSALPWSNSIRNMHNLIEYVATKVSKVYHKHHLF